jgi:hypothetical protein
MPAAAPPFECGLRLGQVMNNALKIKADPATGDTN